MLAELSAEDRMRLIQAAGKVYNPDPAARRQLVKAVVRKRIAERVKPDEELLHETGIRELRRRPVFTTPNYFLEPGDTEPVTDPGPGHALDEKHCYVCKIRYTKIHHFYDQLCPKCAELNFRKRTETVDLSGRVALLTGGRVKIGYQAVDSWNSRAGLTGKGNL